MRAFGGMCRFRLLAGEEAAVRTCGRTRLFTLGESLGGVESLIEHPGRMTHASVNGSPLEVPGDLIRLSVGIEDCDDLLDDLRQALPTTDRKAKRPRPSGVAGANLPRPQVRGDQLRPAGELSLLFSAAACGFGLYARANQAPTAKTMPMTSEPAARSGW